MWDWFRWLFRSMPEVPESIDMRVGPRVIRVFSAFENEVVEIRWHLKDGSTFCHRIMVPPKSVREVRRRERDIDAMKDPA